MISGTQIYNKAVQDALAKVDEQMKALTFHADRVMFTRLRREIEKLNK